MQLLHNAGMEIHQTTSRAYYSTGCLFGLVNYDSYVSFRAVGLMWYWRVDCRAGVFAHPVTPPCSYPVGDQQSRHENHLFVDRPGVWADCMGLTDALEKKKVAPVAASWARILEQGLALDELVEITPASSVRHKGSPVGINRHPPLVLQGGLRYHHRWNSPMVKA